ncbi:uncharacterized protein LOC125675771 isoform X2 [Ostrea edulis]|nr:uncharacterized protein LOC125675771 isoform X2 [Ostrea edulis]XP_048769526.2 uncharacterized protein LOC125675771 isoform X2 [Ostrea edulis]XP_048769527.2 uncharacterized protein LOC125675771 isoform X2 [Ostrea edulis]XP_048769528.2 uncharacterized protein LOC125675771 isoform X2 [Ostrea edulis]
MTTMLGPPHPVAMPTVTKMDKLRLAAAKGEMDMVRDLLGLRTPLQPDKEGRTPLHFAAQNGHLDICRLLIQHGCHPDDQDQVRYTALHRASSQGHTEVIELLINQHCSIDIQDENGNAAIHEAAWHGFSRTLDVLIKHDCNIIITNKAGFTALHLSAQNGHNQSTRILLLAGCNSDLKNNYGDTALHTAARYGHAGVTRILISARCSLNEQNKNGDTALHIASALKRRKIAKLLVDAGVDISVKNKQVETAMDVAERKQHPEIILIISSFSRPKTPKTVNFKEYPVDMEGPVVVPEEEVPAKPVKQEKKFFDFFKKKKKDKEKDKTDSQQTPNTGKSDPSVQGFFSQYVPKPGLQYYRDLAGNIKQGPIGYTPICQCMPTLKKLEHQVHTNQEHIYDHIEASNRALNNRLDQLDHRTSQQVRELDHRTSQRLMEEEALCQERIRRGLEGERAFMEQSHHDNLKMDVQEWLEVKLGSYGHCLDHHHDDTALPSNNLFSEIHQTENGRLFRSRSDETLSQSDNHSGKGFRKKAFYESRQQAMQQIRAWQTPSYSRTNAYRVKGSSHDMLGPRTVTFSDQDNVNVRTSAEIHSQNPPRDLPHSQNPPRDLPHSQNLLRDLPHSQNLLRDLPHSQNSPRDLPQVSAKFTDTSIPTVGPHIHVSQSSVPTRQSEVRPPSRNYSPHPHPRGTSPSVQNRGDPVYGSFRDFPHSVGQSRSPQNPKYEHRSRPDHMSSPRPGQGTVHHQTVSDAVYTSPHQYSSQGAVPKRIPQSQTWHHEQYRNMQKREPSPLTHGTPVNPDQVNKPLPRSQTDSTGTTLRSSPAEVFRRGELPRQSVQEKGTVSNGFIRNTESRQSFPERGPSNTNSGGNLNSSVSSLGAGQGPQDSSRPSSGRSDRPYIPPKPTFTTFGYDNSKSDDRPLPSTSVPNTSSNNAPPKPTPRTNSSAELGSPYASLPNRSHTPHDELDSQQTYSYFAAVKTETPKPSEINRSSSGKETPKDDLYVSMSEKPVIRQRTRSSEGLLDSNITSAHDLKKIHPSPIPFANPNNIHKSDKSLIPHQMPPNGQIQSQQRPMSRPYPNLSMNQYSSEARNSPLLRYGNQPVPVKGAQTESVYVTMKGPHEGRRSAVDFDRKGGPYRTHGNIRENPYASVRDVSSYRYGNSSPMGKSGVPYHSTYNVNTVTQGQNSLSKSESNLVDKAADSDDEGGFISTRRTMLNASPAIHNSANSPKAVSNYPNAYTKEDSSSNPDSGYSSKIFGTRTNNGNVPSNSGTPSSSFSTDHDHSLSVSSNNHSPHPAATQSDYEQIQDVARAVNHGQNLQAHVEGWYQMKLKEAALRLQDGPHNEGPRDQNYNPKGYNPHMNRQYTPPNPQYHNYQANQTYNSYRNLPSYIRGSDV